MKGEKASPSRRGGVHEANGHKDRLGGPGCSSVTRETPYPLRDRTGKVVAVHVRSDYPDGTKDVKWKQPDGTWGLNDRKLEQLPFYGVHELDREAMVVVVTEGEKARDALEGALREAGIPPEQVAVVGTVTGASGTPSEEVLEDLRDFEVILWADADPPGVKHMNRVAERLQGIAALVRVYDWQDAPEVWVEGKDGDSKPKGQDAADHPAVQSGDEDAMDRLLNGLVGAPEWKPPEPKTRPGGKTSDLRSDSEFRLTDTGNAERLVARHGHDLRYVHAEGKWLSWTGKNWQRDDSGEIQRRVKETVRSIYGEAQDASDDTMRRELVAHAMRSEAATRRAAMISLAGSEEGIPVRIDDLDSDPWRLNVQNGTLDLRTGELYEHRREDLLTKIVSVAYEPNAKCPRWERFLREVLVDEDVISFIQRFAGYSLTGSTRERCIAILQGDGKNGKSTAIEVLTAVLGDYAKATSPETILAKRYEGVGNDVAALAGVRFVSTSEIERGRRLAEAKVKQITGGDTVSARFLFSEAFEFRPEFKLWLSTNNVPEISGTDDAIWDRLRLVPFTQRFDGPDANKNLRDELLEELPGILAWMVRGCLDWQRADGLGEPERVKKATADYRDQMDPITDFIEARCVVREGVWVPFAALYDAYREWCGEYQKPETKTKFSNRLKVLEYPPAYGTGNMAIREGIALRSGRGPDDPCSDPSDANSKESRVNRSAPESAHTGPQESRLGEERVNSVNHQGEANNSQNTCKTQGFEEGVNPSYPATNTFRDFSFTRQPFGSPLTNVNSLTPEREREPEDSAPPRPSAPLEDLFSDPPAWLATQLDKCRIEERFVKPTCATVAGEVFGTVTRWAEVEPVLRRHLSKGGGTS